MPPRPAYRSLALAALVAMTTSACALNGLSLAAPGLDKTSPQGSAAPGGKPGGQTPAGQQAGQAGNQQPVGGTLVFPNNVKPASSAAPGAQPGLAWPGPTAPGHSHMPVVVAPTTPGASTPAQPVAPTIAADVPEIYKRIYGVNAIAVENGFVVITTSGLPDHGSPYFDGTTWSDKTEAFNGDEQFNKSPGSIYAVGVTYRIPLTPAVDAAHATTPMGPMGIALNGIPFYNQYAGGGDLISHEIVSFDQYRGHPDPSGEYHYHVEPEYLTAKYGREALLGFLLDGFPVYGPLEAGKELKSADLDAYHGHSHATADFPDGTYHYHVTADAPYINGTGFYGKAGTVVVDRSAGAQSGGQLPGGGTMSPPPGGGSPPPGGMSPPPSGAPLPGGLMPPPPSGCPTPPPPGQTPAPPPPGSSPPPSYCPKPPGAPTGPM